MNRRLSIAAILTLNCLVLAQVAQADPLPGQQLKFVQYPLNGGLPVPGLPYLPGRIPPQPAPFPGHDELSTAHINPQGGTTLFTGQFMADDFADNFDTPVVHVEWWGSYLNQLEPNPNNLVPRFLISFEKDVPQGPDNAFSHPGEPILSQIVTRGPLAPSSGTFTEQGIPTAAGAIEQLFQYNAELAVPFDQDPNTVYWLKIVALDNHLPSDQNAIQWGWHDRDWGILNPLASPVPVPGEHDQRPDIGGVPPMWHFQDDAVSGLVNIAPVPGGILADVAQTGFVPQNYIPGLDMPTFYPENLSKDLAFALYTVPEPSTLWLLSVGTCALAWCNLHRRRR